MRVPNKKPRFSVKTLGCKVNQYETESIISEITESGFVFTPFGEDLDIAIINTCTVTGKASMQARQTIRQTIRQNPKALIIVTGCYAQTEPEEIGKIDGVHIIVSQAEKHRLAEIIQEGLLQPIPNSGKKPQTVWHSADERQPFYPLASSLKGRRTRPYLKVQDGCNAFCSYCVVPYTRGRSRSMPVSDVVKQINRIYDAGFYETVLTGIHIGNYGTDLFPKTNLYELLVKIYKTTSIPRIRLSSIEPRELSGDIVGLVAESERFCRHFHIPLQSGDNDILKQMNRPYTRELFKNLVTGIHDRIPDCGIGVDVLAGFPGETVEAFKNTYDLIEEMPITYLHVFPFSPRKGAQANLFPNRISPREIKQRCRELRLLGIEKKKIFYKKLIGSTVEVLIEGHQTGKNGLLKGITSNYVPVLFQNLTEKKNDVVKVATRKLLHTNPESADMMLEGIIER